MTIDPKLWSLIDALAVETQSAFMKPEPPMSPEEFKTFRLCLLGAVAVALTGAKESTRERAYAALRHYAVYIELRETQTEAGTDLKEQNTALNNFYREAYRALLGMLDEMTASPEPPVEVVRKREAAPTSFSKVPSSSAYREFREHHNPADGHDVRVIQVPFPSKEELDADRRR